VVSPQSPHSDNNNSDVDDFDLGPTKFYQPITSHFESHAGGYVNFYARGLEMARQEELRRRRERMRRRRRNGGVGAERRRWVWRNGKGGKGKRRERTRDEKGRFI
jgi:hypothetical protein